MPDTSVKFFHSGMVGAPVVTTAAGSQIAALDAVLVNGFNTQTATSVVVAGGIATATIPAGQGYEADTVVLVAGATPAGLNGEKRVVTSTSTTVTFDATGISDQTATGTITLKYAPLGWLKAFSGTNQAAYRSQDVTGTQMFLSVESDSASTTMFSVRAYENMTAVATGTGPFPTVAQALTFVWLKGGSVPWIIIGDTKSLYFWRQNLGGGNMASGNTMGFGDFKSAYAVDAYRCFIAAHFGTGSLSSSTIGASGNEGAVELLDVDTSWNGIYAHRSASGAATPQSLYKFLENYTGTTAYVASGGTSNPGGPALATYPMPANSGLLLSRIALADSNGLRGWMRGVLGTPQNCHASFGQLDRITGQGSFAGKRLLALKCGSPAGNTSQGVLFFDITGPWES